MALLEKDKLEKIPPKRCNSQIKIARATYFLANNMAIKDIFN